MDTILFFYVGTSNNEPSSNLRSVVLETTLLDYDLSYSKKDNTLFCGGATTFKSVITKHLNIN